MTAASTFRPVKIMTRASSTSIRYLNRISNPPEMYCEISSVPRAGPNLLFRRSSSPVRQGESDGHRAATKEPEPVPEEPERFQRSPFYCFECCYGLMPS